MTTNLFKKAERKKAKLRLGLTGPSGSGKSYSALTLAKAIGGKIAAIDTEHGSLSLYTNLCDFDSIDMQAPYTPERMIEYIQMAEANGYDVLIIDSITHEWSGAGGCLEINDRLANSKFKGNTWSAWSETTPRHRKLLDTIISSGMHIIVTLRSKTETVQGEGKKVFKVGMKSEQRDGFEYELTVVLDIVHDGHAAVASKDRTGIFTDKDPAPITEATGRALIAWLNSGAEPTPEPPPAPAPAPKSPPRPPAAPPAQSRFEKALDAINKAATAERIEFLHNYAVDLKIKGELTADEMLELSQLCESRIAEFSPNNHDAMQPI